MASGEANESIGTAALWRIGIVLLAIVLAMVGRHWMSLRYLTFFVGGTNPSGTQVVTYIYNDSGPGFLNFPQIRDSESGELLHDLSDLEPAWGDSVVWIDDTTLVALKSDRSLPESERRCFVDTVKLSSDGPSVERNKVADQHVSAIVPDGRGQYCFSYGKNHGENRYFKIMRAPAGGGIEQDEVVELARFELGDQEEAYMSRFSSTPVGKVLVYVVPSMPARRKTNTPKEVAPDDFKLTDGVNQTRMMLDAATGELVQTLTDYDFVDNSDQYVWKETVSGIEIYRLDAMENPVETLVAKNVGSLYPMAVTEQHVVFVERVGMNPHLRIFDRKSRVEKEFTFPERTSLHVGKEGSIYLFPRDGSLAKFEPETGESQFIATARPYYWPARVAACLGIPLLLVLASATTLFTGKRMPFLDMGLACVLIACVFGAWSGIEGSDKRLLLTLTQASLGAVIAILLVWVSTSRALYGIAIPVAIVTIAVVLSLYIFAWSESAGAMFEMAVAAPLFIFFQALGHVLFRRFIGTINGPNASADNRRQFSVRQIAITTAAIAFLLACLRNVEVAGNRVPKEAMAWMLAFTFNYAVCVVWSVWGAFKLQNVFASGIATFFGATLFISLLFVGTKRLTSLNIDGTPYIQPLVAAIVVWWTLRLCRRVGYQITKNSAVPVTEF